MADRSIITPELCREFLTYDHATGVLRWRRRDRRHFSTDHAAVVWNGRFPGKLALCTPSDSGYLTGAIFAKAMFAHRVAWAVFYGEWPPHEVDHINGRKDDNRIVNLRSVTRTENGRNRSRYKNTLVHAGVRMEPNGKWSARIADIRLGTYLTKDEAIAARKAGELCLGFHPNHGRAK